MNQKEIIRRSLKFETIKLPLTTDPTTLRLSFHHEDYRTSHPFAKGHPQKKAITSDFYIKSR